MSRAIGPNQRRIRDILLEARPADDAQQDPRDALALRAGGMGRPTTESQALAGLARRGLVRLAGGDWERLQTTSLASEEQTARQKN